MRGFRVITFGALEERLLLKRIEPQKPRMECRGAVIGPSCALVLALSGLSALPALAATEQVRSIGMDTSAYFYSQSMERDSLYPTLMGSWDAKTQGSWFESAIGARVQLALKARSSAAYFELPQAYIGTSAKAAPVSLKMGRKLEHWSRLDEAWNLGLWQPRFRWDYIRPETVGLTGAFLSIEQPSFRFVAMGTPVFVPERGVPTQVENGQVSSQSPWFIPPPSSIIILDKETPVQYDIQIPPISQIVFHPGASFLARVGGEEGAWGQASYAYKPMNQLLLAYDGYLQLDGENPNYAKAQIYPRVVYHHLAGLEAGYAGKRVSGWVSALSDRPVRDVTPVEWTTQEVSDAIAVSANLEFALTAQESAPRAEVSYLRSWGGNASDSGPYGIPNGSRFDTRYPFQDAASVGVRTPFLRVGSKGQRLAVSAKLLHDFSHAGSILSTELQFRPHLAWSVSVGADVLGSDAASTGDFISRYRSNDRVHAGVSYVF